MRVKFFIICILLGLFSPTFSQQIQVRGKFLSDSVSIGEPVGFALVAGYDSSVDILFPDSLSSAYGKFEYIKRDNFPTYSKEAKWVDSSVYWLQTFEIDTIQYLQLPVIVFDKVDSSKVFSNLDSLYFKHLIPTVSDTTQLVSNTDFAKVKRIFNTPLYGLILGILGILLLISTLIFGKKIMRYFAIKKLKKDYAQFDAQYSQILNQIRNKPSSAQAEQGVSLVKHYLTKLEKIPYASFTTAELLTYPHFQKLREGLKILDRAIYGGIIENDLYKPMQQIEDLVQDRYKEALDNLSNGK